MRILGLIDDNVDVTKTLKAIRQFGIVQMAAQEKYKEIKTNYPDLLGTLTPRILKEADYDSLIPEQRFFKELFELRESLSVLLKSSGYPVLDNGIKIEPITENNQHRMDKLRDLMETALPFQTHMSCQGRCIIILTTEKAIEKIKEILIKQGEVDPGDIHHLSKDSTPIVFAGMATPNETQSVIDEISSFLKKNVIIIEQDPDNLSFDA